MSENNAVKNDGLWSVRYRYDTIDMTSYNVISNIILSHFLRNSILYHFCSSAHPDWMEWWRHVIIGLIPTVDAKVFELSTF